MELGKLEVLSSEAGSTFNDGLQSCAQVLELRFLDGREVALGGLGGLLDVFAENDGRLDFGSRASIVGRVKTSPVQRTLFIAICDGNESQIHVKKDEALTNSRILRPRPFLPQ